MKSKLYERMNLISRQDHHVEKQKDKQKHQETVERLFPAKTFCRAHFETASILGNLDKGFIILCYEGDLYLVDQHAASQKSLFQQILDSPESSKSVSCSKTFSLPNIYKLVLQVEHQKFKMAGWEYRIKTRGAVEFELSISRAPKLYNKVKGQQQFINLVDSIYCGSNYQKTHQEMDTIASFSCHNSFRFSDKLKQEQMRTLIDNLASMKSPFNCPHGRPTIIHLLDLKQQRFNSQIQIEYTFDF